LLAGSLALLRFYTPSRFVHRTTKSRTIEQPNPLFCKKKKKKEPNLTSNDFSKSNEETPEIFGVFVHMILAPSTLSNGKLSAWSMIFAGQAHLKIHTYIYMYIYIYIYIARGEKPLMARSKKRGQREG
jgi:hypothetical protein